MRRRSGPYRLEDTESADALRGTAAGSAHRGGLALLLLIVASCRPLEAVSDDALQEVSVFLALRSSSSSLRLRSLRLGARQN